MIGDVGNTGARQESASTCDNRRANFFLPIAGKPILSTEDKFDFQSHWFVIGPPFNHFCENIGIAGLNSVGWSPPPQIAKEREDFPPWRLAPDKFVALPAPPKGFQFLKRPDVGHHQIRNRRLIRLVGLQFFFIDEFEEPRDASNRCGERANRATHFENQQALWRERGRVRPQFQSSRVSFEDFGETIEFGCESVSLSGLRKGFRLAGKPWLSGGTIAMGLRRQPQQGLAWIARHLAPPVGHATTRGQVLLQAHPQFGPLPIQEYVCA